MIHISATPAEEIPGFDYFNDLDLKITLGDHINIYTRNEVLAEISRHNRPEDVTELEQFRTSVASLPEFSYISFGAQHESEDYTTAPNNVVQRLLERLAKLSNETDYVVNHSGVQNYIGAEIERARDLMKEVDPTFNYHLY